AARDLAPDVPQQAPAPQPQATPPSEVAPVDAAMQRPVPQAGASSTRAEDARPSAPAASPPQPAEKGGITGEAFPRRAREPPMAAQPRATADSTVAKLPDAAISSRGSAPDQPESAAAPQAVPSGTLVIDFINSFSEGVVEVEVDGRKRWSEKLRLGKN